MIDLLIQFSRFKGIIVQWLRAPGINIGTTSAAVEPSRALFRAVEPDAKRNNASRAATGRLKPAPTAMTVRLKPG